MYRTDTPDTLAAAPHGQPLIVTIQKEIFEKTSHHHERAKREIHGKVSSAAAKTSSPMKIINGENTLVIDETRMELGKFYNCLNVGDAAARSEINKAMKLEQQGTSYVATLENVVIGLEQAVDKSIAMRANKETTKIGHVHARNIGNFLTGYSLWVRAGSPSDVVECLPEEKFKIKRCMHLLAAGDETKSEIVSDLTAKGLFYGGPEWSHLDDNDIQSVKKTDRPASMAPRARGCADLPGRNPTSKRAGSDSGDLRPAKRISKDALNALAQYQLSQAKAKVAKAELAELEAKLRYERAESSDLEDNSDSNSINEENQPARKGSGAIEYDEDFEEVKCSFVYCIRELGSTTYKIGFSKHPLQRRGKLQTGNSRILELVWQQMVSKPKLAETQMHDAVKEYHVHGEWYDFKGLYQDEVKQMMQDLAEEFITELY